MENKFRKKILLIIPELNLGGAQRSFSNLSTALANEYEVYNVVFKEIDSQYELGGPLFSLDVHPGKSLLSKATAFWKRVTRLKAIKKKLNIVASISFLEGADYVNLLSQCNDRIVISIRGSKFSDREIKGVMGWLRLHVFMPLLYKRADRVVCVSDGIRTELREQMKLSEKRLKTIYNFYDLENHDNVVANLGQSIFDSLLNFKCLVCVGRFHPQKNFTAAIEIFSRIHKHNPDWKLLIAGDGQEKAMLIQLSNERGLRVYDIATTPLTTNFDVFFCGVQVPSLLLRYAKGFLLTSMWEGFPNVLLEAMACSIPVFASDCYTGPREILAPETRLSQPVTVPLQTDYGMLMPLPDRTNAWEQWATTITEALKDPGRNATFAEAGRRRIESFDKKQILSQWMQVIG